MKRFSRLLFTFIPWYCVIGIPLALIFKLQLKEIPLIPNIALMWLLYLALMPTGYFIREAGRLLWAKIAGGVPHHMIIGTGRKLDEFEIFRVKIAIYENINTGISQAFFSDQSFLKWRYGIYLAGRVLTSGGLAALFIVIWGWHLEAFVGIHSPDLLTAFIAANLHVFLANILYATHYNYRDVDFVTDGLTLWKLPQTPQKNLVTYLPDIQLMDAKDYLRQGKYKKAYRLLQTLMDDPKETIRFYARLKMAGFLLEKAKFQKSLQMYQSIEALIQKPSFNAFASALHQGLAWNYLALENAQQAHIQTQLAQAINPRDIAAVQLVQGATWVACGMPHEGIEILHQHIDFSTNQEYSLRAAIFVCDGFLRQGDPTGASKYYEYVTRHSENLSLINQYFWHKVSRTFVENQAFERY